MDTVVFTHSTLCEPLRTLRLRVFWGQLRNTQEALWYECIARHIRNGQTRAVIKRFRCFLNISNRAEKTQRRGARRDSQRVECISGVRSFRSDLMFEIRGANSCRDEEGSHRHSSEPIFRRCIYRLRPQSIRRSRPTLFLSARLLRH